MIDSVAAVLSDTLIMTGLLIVLVLLVRRPVTKALGPRLGYALWLIPALRLMLPPLPGEEQVVVAAAPPTAAMIDIPLDAVAASAATGVPAPMLLDQLLMLLPFVWLTGAVFVLGLALTRHRRWHRALLDQATPLAPVDGIKLVMSAAIDGPIATGLLQPVIAVPCDFFTRYNRTERRLAIEHEVAHHRSGDMWANAAALLVLAAQWFNPFAWLALRAFRFDQEAACDARVLAGLGGAERGAAAHSYACAIAKSLTGPRLLLAAPMTSGNKVKERLQMLSQDPQLGPRPFLGRAILGGAIVGALALTISTLPARIVYAAEPDAAPAVSEAPPPPGAEKKQIREVMIIHGGEDADKDGAETKDGAEKKRSVHRIMIHGDGADGEQPRVMMFGGEHDAVAGIDMKMDPSVGMAPRIRVAMPMLGPMFGLNNDELRATLKEQGIDDAKADAIIKSLDKRRSQAATKARDGLNRARLSMVPLIPSTHGFPMTEGTYRNLRQLSVSTASEKELLEQTLNAMTVARDSLARKIGSDEVTKQPVLESLDREIEHLRSKIKRL